MHRSFVTAAVLAMAAALAYSQAAPPAGQAAPANAAQIQQLQQQMAPLQQQVAPIQHEIQVLQQRAAAQYAGDTPAAQLQQRIQTLQAQLDQLQAQLQPLQQQMQALGGGGRGGFGAFGGGRGGRGAVTVPDNATPEQLRDAVQRLQQQNQALQQQMAASRPAAAPAPPPCVPVNPNATQEAKDLLKRLCDVSGKGILTGQHNFPNERTLDTDAIHAATGRYPAIWGSDFGFTNEEDKDAITHRNLMIEEAKRQYAAGSVIYLCWHMLRPTEDEPGTPGASWSGSVQARLNDDQWLELITSDSPLHQRWEKYMDTAAGYLQQLQDAHIPVLWRPMHENNGTFFWWGGRPGEYGTAELYREVYNRMVNVHHLNNLVWVWNQNGPAPGGEFYNFFPGAKYCDVVTYDNYSTLDHRFYDEIMTIANGKPVGFGEVGTPPPPEVLLTQPRWSFYMTWAGMSGAASAGGRGGRGGAQAEAPAPIPVPDNATPEQLRQIIQQLHDRAAASAFGGRGATAYPVPDGASVDVLRRIVARLQPGANTLKILYDDPWYIKRGDPMPK
jgi:mannan endo-1,4-beta-mannosidase